MQRNNNNDGKKIILESNREEIRFIFISYSILSLFMELSTDSGIQSSCIIEIKPLEVSHDLGKESGFEVDI